MTLPGALAIRLVVTGESFSYLKPSMRGPLLAAGVVLVVLGVLTVIKDFLSTRRSTPEESWGDHDAADHGHAGDHDHAAHGGRHVAWLLVLPLLAVNLVPPAPLGAFAANRETTATEVTGQGKEALLPLPAARDGATDIDLRGFYLRAQYEDENLVGAPVRLVGFVVRDPKISDGYVLTRFAIGCCAADAYPVRIVVHGVRNPPPDDTWVEVTGLWRAPVVGVRTKGPTLDVESQRLVEQPERPYL